MVSGDWTAYWVYVVGPMTGAAIAVECARILGSRGCDPISRAAGAGVLRPRRAEEKAEPAGEIDAGKVVAPRLEPTSTSTDAKR